MVKVMWFLRKADHLSMEEFRQWWLEGHAPMISAKQGHLISRYVVNVSLTDDLPGGTGVDAGWDGVAEEWFETIDVPTSWRMSAQCLASSFPRTASLTGRPIAEGAAGRN
jgi:EthD domain